MPLKLVLAQSWLRNLPKGLEIASLVTQIRWPEGITTYW